MKTNPSVLTRANAIADVIFLLTKGHLMNTSPTPLALFAKRLLEVGLVCGVAIFLAHGIVDLPTARSQGEERRFKCKEFPNMPLRVRKVRNLQSETWPNDLEIEVENVSDKPIYFINAALIFPDDPAPNGESGITLKYGKSENMDVGRIAEAQDEHLDPGKRVSLVVDTIYKKGLLVKQKQTPENLKRLEFSFDIVSFGDGTGFEAGEFLQLRKKTN
jgi:hypothetical protein